MTFDEQAHFKRRDAVHAAIDAWKQKHPREGWAFPAKYGLAMARLDIEWWSSMMRDARKRVAFVKAARALIAAQRPFKNGMEVPRGIEIERLYYRIEKGYTDAQYAAHAASYD